MKSFAILFFYFLLTSCFAQGQPGGGGGVIIQTLIDKNGHLISSRDSGLVIRKFILSDAVGLSVQEYHSNQEKSSFPKHATVNQGGLYIRPYIGVYDEIKMPHQLIQFIYRGDTVFVEFEDIKMKDGTGYSNWLDTLQLIPGRYKIPFRFLYGYYTRNGTAADNKRYDSISALARRGITATTIPMLRNLGLLYIMINERFTTIYQNANNTFDTDCLPVKPVYVMKVGAIAIGKKRININVNAAPMLENDTLLYRILMQVPPLNTIAVMNRVNDDQLEAIRALNKLSFKQVYINRQPYTGYLKVFIPFSEFRPGNVTISGFSLSVFYFEDGILLHREDIPDIELDESDVPKRLS
jgi:hypothetical protein